MNNLEIALGNILIIIDKNNYSETNIQFYNGYIEKLDELGITQESVDVIVSNCVVNLSPDKEVRF